MTVSLFLDFNIPSPAKGLLLRGCTWATIFHRQLQTHLFSAMCWTATLTNTPPTPNVILSVFLSLWVFSSFSCVFSLHMNTEHSTSLQSSSSPQSSWTLYSDISGAEASERVKTICTSKFKHIKASKECYLLGQNTTCKFSDSPLYQTIKQHWNNSQTVKNEM